MDDQIQGQPRSGGRGAIGVVLLATLASGFWFYQGMLRRERIEWITAVRSLGLGVSVIPASQWTAQMYVPGPQGIIDREIVIVTVDSELQGRALLTAPSSCPDDVKIYAFDGLSTARYSELEERFPSAVLFTRLEN